MRESGILLPIFSLPGKYGIGCFSKEAYRFVDFLKASGQSLWQAVRRTVFPPLDSVDDQMVNGDSIDFDKNDIRRNLTLFLYPDASPRRQGKPGSSAS